MLCCLLGQEIGPRLLMNRKPEVDWELSGPRDHPASVYPWKPKSIESSVPLNLSFMSLVAWMYLSTCFAASQCTCYDHFFSFVILFHRLTFSSHPHYFSAIPSDFYLHQLVLSCQLRSSTYSSLLSYSFSFYDDTSLGLGQVSLGLCTLLSSYINCHTSCSLSLTLTYSILL